MNLFLSTKSEIMNGFGCLRCLSNCIDLPNMIGPFAAGTPNPLLDKYYALFMHYQLNSDIIVSRGEILL